MNKKESKTSKAIRYFLGRDRKSVVYGDARWMKKSEEKKFFYTKSTLSPIISPERETLKAENKGLIVGDKRLTLKESYKHLCVIAPTGFGKTTRYVIENVLNCSGSMVVTDPSKEIFDATAGYLAQRGYDIKVLEPANPQQSHKFNAPFYYKTPQKLKQLATSIANAGLGDDDRFWMTGAIKILFLGLLALSQSGRPAFNTLGNLHWLLNHIGVDRKKVDGFMVENLDEVQFAGYLAFVNQEPKVVSNIISSALVALDLWDDPNVVELTSTNNIDIESFRKKKTITYLVIPEDEIEYFSPVLNLFYSACFETIIKMGKQPGMLPLFFFLDEFGNLGKIPRFSTIITTLRKRNCSISVVLQGKSQLASIYGDNDAETIYSGGLVNKVFFPGMGLADCKYLEALLGTNTIYDTDSEDASEDRHRNAIARPLMTSDQIRQMNINMSIIVSGRERPVILETRQHFNTPELSKLAELTPPTLHFDVAEPVQRIPFDTIQASKPLPSA